jgi:cobalt-zinc-cadmium efflux system protein
LASDAGVSLGVVISSVIIIFTSWFWMDPLVSILISIVTVFGTWGLFKESGNLLLQAVPAHIDANKVSAYLLALPDVAKMHDLHIWALSTTEVALSVHLVLKNCPQSDVFLQNASAGLEKVFGIHHITIQIETSDYENFCTVC